MTTASQQDADAATQAWLVDGCPYPPPPIVARKLEQDAELRRDYLHALAEHEQSGAPAPGAVRINTIQIYAVLNRPRFARRSP